MRRDRRARLLELVDKLAARADLSSDAKADIGEARSLLRGGRPKVPEIEYRRLAQAFRRFQKRNAHLRRDLQRAAFLRELDKRAKANKTTTADVPFGVKRTRPGSLRNAIKKGEEASAAVRARRLPQMRRRVVVAASAIDTLAGRRRRLMADGNAAMLYNAAVETLLFGGANSFLGCTFTSGR